MKKKLVHIGLMVAILAFYPLLSMATDKGHQHGTDKVKKEGPETRPSVTDHFAHHDSGKFRDQLRAFIGEVLKSNPELATAKKRVAAFRERPDFAYSLEDPKIQFGLLNFPTSPFLSSDTQDMTQKKISVMQKFPFPGKRSLRRDIAQDEAAITEEEFLELQRSLVERVKKSTFELCLVLVSIQITTENKALLKKFVKIAETKYATGKGIQHDVIKAQVELSKLLDELIVLERRKETEIARLNTLMNKLPQAPLDFTHGIRKSDFKYNLEELQSMALKNRPVLKGWNRLITKFKNSKKLAEKEYYPDFDVSLGYGQREDQGSKERPDFFSASVTVNVPLWHKTRQGKKVSEESYNIEMAEYRYNSAKNDIFQKIKELHDKEKEQSRQLELFQTAILPQARQSLNSALYGYRVDKVDFLTLLDNQITLQKWEIKHHGILVDYEKNLAELERAVGKELFHTRLPSPRTHQH